MFQGIQDEQIAAACEAMLFVSDEPVSVIALADILQVDPVKVESALSDLREKFAQDNRGIQLSEVAGGWRLVTHPQYHELLEQYVLSWDTRKLTQAALETLAIVAYCQPITRAGIASVRGVSSDSSINSLLEKGLLREAGVQDTPGNPVLYATTKVFLEKFGLRSVEDLPPLDSFAPDAETRALISNRLNVVRSEMVPFSEELLEAKEPEQREAESLEEAMRDMLSQALQSSAGVVEKINFDELIFEED